VGPWYLCGIENRNVVDWGSVALGAGATLVGVAIREVLASRSAPTAFRATSGRGQSLSIYWLRPRTSIPRPTACSRWLVKVLGYLNCPIDRSATRVASSGRLQLSHWTTDCVPSPKNNERRLGVSQFWRSRIKDAQIQMLYGKPLTIWLRAYLKCLRPWHSIFAAVVRLPHRTWVGRPYRATISKSNWIPSA